MLKIYIIPYLYIAIGLVAGEWQPQGYGQNPQIYTIPPPVPPPPQIGQRQIYSAVIPEQPPRIPQARPCRRRNNGDPGAMLTDSGWVFLPKDQQTKFDQQTRSQPFQPQLSPQSLTENNAPDANDQKQEVKQSPKSQLPDNIVEYVEKSSLPNQMSQKRYIDKDENKKKTDQVLNDNLQDAANTIRTGNLYGAGRERVDSDEISQECGGNGDPDHGLRPDNSETPKPLKEAREQAAKTLPECVQTSRRSMQNEDDLRKFEPSISSSEVDKTSIEIQSEPEPNEDSTTNLMQLARMPNKPYFQNPAKNAGKWQSNTHVSLLENGRVCYACSTFFDPSCWTTNATTTVKYCNKDNNACLSKMYKIEGKVILIRDCGHTCNDDDQYDVGLRMTSCTKCNDDLCNGACTLSGLTALLVTLIASAVKFTS